MNRFLVLGVLITCVSVQKPLNAGFEGLHEFIHSFCQVLPSTKSFLFLVGINSLNQYAAQANTQGTISQKSIQSLYSDMKSYVASFVRSAPQLSASLFFAAWPLVNGSLLKGSGYMLIASCVDALLEHSSNSSSDRQKIPAFWRTFLPIILVTIAYTEGSYVPGSFSLFATSIVAHMSSQIIINLGIMASVRMILQIAHNRSLIADYISKLRTKTAWFSINSRRSETTSPMSAANH